MNHNTRFVEVDTLRDPDGVAVIVTQKADSQYLSFRFVKEYESQGEVRTTAYLGRQHIPAMRRLLDEVESMVSVTEDQAKVYNVRERQNRGRK